MTLFATLACLASLLVGGSVLLAAPAGRAMGMARMATALAGLSFVAAAVGAGLVCLAGPSEVAAFGVSLRLDTVSAVFGLVIGFVGLSIVQFSVGYLAGEKRQPVFMGLLLLTLFFAQLLALAGDVVVFGLAWVGMSLPVQKLLTYFERPGAVIAARLKFGFARASDLTLLAGLSLLVTATGSIHIGVIDAAADASKPLAGAAVVLLAIAILLRSAQVPTHTWLLRAVEAPTPVSAVLHAGVVNAGGLVALRFAPVLAESALAMNLIALVAGITVLVALGAVSSEQRVKSRLAWSTVAQMGFMLIECSLGLFGLALLHIAAHAFYKSFVFLNAGTLTPVRPVAAPGWGGALVVVATFAAIVWIVSPLVVLDPASLLIGSIFVLGLAVLGGRAWSGSKALPLMAAATATALWLGLHEIAIHLMPSFSAHWTAFSVVSATAMIVALALLVAHSSLLNRPAIKALAVHIRNGFYIHLVTERLAVRPLITDHAETAK